MKDWKGNSNSIFKTLASSHHCEDEREEHDYYATDPRAVEMLLDMHPFSKDIWEPACGEGHLSKAIEKMGYAVKSTDLVDRGFGEHGINFLSNKISIWGGDIITNPPYRYAKEFIVKALSIIPDGRQVAMFLKIQFVEGKGRKDLFVHFPPKVIYVSSSRINCAKNGDFAVLRESGGSAVAYAWYVWEKGYQGETKLKWFN
jgi:hypothetical protein